MPPVDKSYEEGLRDGKIEALERVVADHRKVLDAHSQRLTAQERITYGLLAIIGFIEIYPRLGVFLGAG